MFGKKKRQPAKVLSGDQRFGICGNKEIIYDNDDIGLRGAELHCPKTEDKRIIIKVTSDACYRTDQYVKKTDSEGRKVGVFKSPEVAYRFLGQSAAANICKGCPYATMNPLQVSEARANLAEEPLRAAQNDLRRLQALAAHAEAQREIYAIEQRMTQLPTLAEPEVC